MATNSTTAVRTLSTNRAANSSSGGGGSTTTTSTNTNTLGGSRKYGHQSSGNTLSPGGAFGVATQIKMQAEAPFRRVKVFFQNRSPTYPAGPWVVSAAATENPFNTTDAEFCQPIVNGTTYTALATDLATQYGYKQGRFGGALQSPQVPPGTFSPEYRDRLNIPRPTTQPYNSFFNMVGTVASDWIDVRSVPATDGGRPWLLLRAQTIETNANDYGARYGITFNVQANTDTSIDLRAQPGFCDFRAVTQNPTSGQNFVTNPALQFLRPTDLQIAATANITVLFDYGIPTRNVFLIGDSVTDAYPWGEIAFSQLSTPTKPINFVNCGEAARQSFQFNHMIEAYVEAGMVPTDVVLPVFTVNDFNPGSTLNDFTATDTIFRVLERIRYINSLGAKVWLWTAYNARPGYGFQSLGAPIVAINNYFRAYAAANPATCGLFDFEANWIDGQGPTTYTKDGTHPNNNGVLQGMVPVVLREFK